MGDQVAGTEHTAGPAQLELVRDALQHLIQGPRLAVQDQLLREHRETHLVLVEERTGHKIEHPRQWIGAASAMPDVAALLEIPAGVPVLKVRRITLVAGDASIEFVEAYFHPERYQHYNELSTRPEELPV